MLGLAAETPLGAQAPLGSRASGLGGAFVGVADDATAVYWNPSGLATGAIASLVLDYGRKERLPAAGSAAGGERLTAGAAVFSMPALGLAYYRLGGYAAAPRAAATGGRGREEVGRTVQSVVTSVAGLTLLHSVSDALVVGGTIKLVRGEAAANLVPAVDAAGAVAAAARLRRTSRTAGDVDLSAMLAIDRVRVGIVARNLTTPKFALDGTASSAVELDRQLRVGGAWGSGWPGVSRWVAAVDADLTMQRGPSGARRDLAAGLESWWLGRRLGLRGGLRGNLEGAAQPVASGGVSVLLARGVFVDGHVARGGGGQRSWGLGVRLGF